MSIRDYYKVYNVLNVTTNELEKISLNNKRLLMVTLTKSELDLFEKIKDALDNDCNVSVSIGYKRQD